MQQSLTAEQVVKYFAVTNLQRKGEKIKVKGIFA
jgi:hypothetical protein